MKKNNLTTAVIAGIAGIAGIASVSNAVNLNSDGVGQVLVYPYYTVNNGLNTLISVVNTTDQVKAVKVRFLEGKNSRECLDFNLYLSEYDVWTSALSATTATSNFAGSFYAGMDTVNLGTADTSCTAPSISGYQFLPWGFDPEGNGKAADGYDEGGRDLARCTEGHFEIIEMGNVVDTVGNSNAATAATHGVPGSSNAGVPNNCGTITSNWSVATGFWVTTPQLDPEHGIEAPTGGLFGSASLIDVATGVDVAYNADAIQAYSTEVQHSDTGSVIPSLSTGNVVTSNIFNNGMVQTDIWNSDPVQAVSALYMHNKIYGEYALDNSIGAQTEWVVTFPTKYAYVDSFKSNFGVVPYEPFTTAFTSTGGGTACEEYGISMWDREEQYPTGDPSDLLPSPPPPGIVTTVPIFCWETNVLEFHDGDFDPADASGILGSKLNAHLKTQATSTPEAYFANGWVALTFVQGTDDNFGGNNYAGLPVTGFAVQRYVNASDASGARNYAGLFAHRYARNISS